MTRTPVTGRALLCAGMLAWPALLHAQGTVEDYERAAVLNRQLTSSIYHQPTGPQWIDDSNRFWYRIAVRGGNRWFLVDAPEQVKRPLFDHALLAESLSAATGDTFTTLTLPFAQRQAAFTVLEGGNAIRFVHNEVTWRCELAEYLCTRIEPQRRGERADDPPRRASPEEQFRRSPDEQWEAFIWNHNLAIRPAGGAERRVLSYDGTEGDAYTLGSIRWSPDSMKIAAYRLRPGYRRLVHYIETAPDDQVQPRYSNRVYEKPGDVRDRNQPVIFNLETGRQFIVDSALFPDAYDLRRPRWRDDSRAFTFEYNERGHRVYRVIEVNPETGQARALISEEPETFFSYYSMLWRHDVDDGREILWMSERDGWKHIWLYDGQTGRVKNQVTRGPWVVRGVDHVDEEKRQIFFRAGGMHPGQDPYLIHYYRINFDGTGLLALTDSDANHTLSWSPDRSYYVATRSRVDQPPVMDLHQAGNGRQLMELERTDISELPQLGWRMPEVFSAKGRDGVTDIWGIILRPTTFDPNRSYPVIEYIYAGPHSAFVPKGFGTHGGMQALAELGFIVVQIDGMGTAHRSKAFHDVAWKNIGDAGFPDRILWHQAVAAEYPYYDVSRVGIYGTSAGGQNAMGALLFHPEFYTVAVSAVGCHDNRMDKISWNEQWMSYPVGPHYEASSNVVHAHRLQGRLLLIVGELDTNVDPASTMQVVRALIQADKTFDLLVLPGQGHTAGGTYGTRARNDFFVRHLLGIDPPDWNRIATARSLLASELSDWLVPVNEEAPEVPIWR